MCCSTTHHHSFDPHASMPNLMSSWYMMITAALYLPDSLVKAAASLLLKVPTGSAAQCMMLSMAKQRRMHATWHHHHKGIDRGGRQHLCCPIL
jgi:hypothetical protein